MAGAKRSEETKLAIKIWTEQKYDTSIAKAAEIAGIAPSTLYRALFPWGKRKHEKYLALRK